MHTVGLPRTCLGLTNFVFFMIGLICCLICVWCAVNTEFFKDVNYTITKSNHVSNIADFVNLKLWLTPMTAIIAPIALIAMMTSCCGILGAGCRIKCAMKTYIFLVTVASGAAFWIFFISGVYNIYTYNEKTTIYLRTSLKTYYGKQNDLITYLWNYVMTDYECCGAIDWRDFDDSYWKTLNPDSFYPIQCCVLANKTGLYPVSTNCTRRFDAGNQSNRDVGCVFALRDAIINNKGKLITYVILLAMAYLILIFFASCIMSGEPLLGQMGLNSISLLPTKPQPISTVDTTNFNPKYNPSFNPSAPSRSESVMLTQPPKKVVRVVSPSNPFQTYQFTPNAYANSEPIYGHNMRSQM